MVTANIWPAMDFDIQKRSLPFLVDDDMINLIYSIPIRGPPAQFVDISVGEDVSVNYAPVAKPKLNKPLSVVVDGSTAVPPNCILCPAVSISNLVIQISSYHVVVFWRRCSCS